MHDYMSFCLHSFYQRIGWNEHNQFTSLLLPSKAILDFPLPQGLAFSFARSPTTHLHSCYSIVPFPYSRLFTSSSSTNDITADPEAADGQEEEKDDDETVFGEELFNKPTPPIERPAQEPALGGNVAFLFSNVPLFPSLEAKQTMIADYSELLDRFSEPLPSSVPTTPGKNYLLYARVFSPSRLMETLAVIQLNQHNIIKITSQSSPSINPGKQQDGPDIWTCIRWQRDLGYYSVEASLDSQDGGMLGINGMVHLNWCSEKELWRMARLANRRALKGIDLEESGVGQWTLGGEVFYHPLESSGGVSSCVRYRSLAPRIYEATCTLQPLLGHLSLAYTCFLPLFPTVTPTASSLIPTTAAAPTTAPTAAPTCFSLSTRYDFNVYSYESDLSVGFDWFPGIERLVKMRFGLKRGLQIMLDGRYRNAWFSFGIMRGNGSSFSVGLNLQYFL